MCVCVQGFLQDFEFWEEGTPKFGVDMKGVSRGVWGYAPPDFFNYF